jgi:DNA-binding GntR family transcriptional regulator
MSDESAVARSVLAEQVKDRLLQDILAGRYPPHSRIVETRVARELGTSQAPVREALRGLEALGVVEILPFRGARVRRPSTSELLEAYAVRSELEALAARLGVPRMSDADMADLEALGEEMQKAASIGDRHEVAVADASFHARLLSLAGNSTLERVWRSLEPFSRTYITLVAPGADAHWTADLHPAILRALRTRDAEQVVAALRRHFDEASAHLAGGWDDGRPAPAPGAGGTAHPPN